LTYQILVTKIYNIIQCKIDYCIIKLILIMLVWKATVLRKIFMHCNSPQKSAEQGKQQKNVNLSAKQLLSHTHVKYLYMLSM